MRCQHIGEKTGLPCTRRQEGHPAEHRYSMRWRASKAIDGSGGRRITVPEGSIKMLGLSALERYRASGLELEGDTLVPKLRKKLSQ